MRYLSVCSGIEAATVAWHPLGFEPVGFSEIEKFPNKLLAHHYPDVTNYGDIEDYKSWKLPRFDLLVGGTPCQAFSIAGLRGGIDDARGNLSLVYSRILARHRPTWFVWENVPGLLSLNGGRDMGAIVRAMGELGYGIAWRVLDAQYFGVPQRRRRLFIVGCRGDAERAFKVLFEPESLRGDSPPSRQAEPEPAPGTPRCTHPSGLYATIDANEERKWGSDQWVNNGKAILCPPVANALTQRMWKGINSNVTEGQTPIVVNGTQDPIVSDIAQPLQQERATNVLAFKPSYFTRGKDGKPNDIMPPLTADADKGDQDPVLAIAENQRAELLESEIAAALSTGGGKPGQGYPAIRDGLVVRRLTPLECERLQGFPDGYTDIPRASDTARYKALGNSMAVPVMRWIAEGIEDVC